MNGSAKWINILQISFGTEWRGKEASVMCKELCKINYTSLHVSFNPHSMKQAWWRKWFSERISGLSKIIQGNVQIQASLTPRSPDLFTTKQSGVFFPWQQHRWKGTPSVSDEHSINLY